MNTSAQSLYLYILFAVCFISGMIGATVSTLMSSFLPVVLKDLQGNLNGINENSAAAWINSIFLFGWMFGGFLWGLFCDYFGRKKAFIYSTLLYGLGAILIAVVGTWEYLLIFLFIAGFGVGGVIVTTTILISEAWTPSKRSMAIGLLTVCFPIGIFLSGAITYFIQEWRVAFMIGVFPILLAILSIWILKEPTEEQEDFSPGFQKQNLKLLFNNTNRKNVLIGTLTFGTMLIGLWAVFAWLPTWIQSILESGEGQKERGFAMMSLAVAALFGSASSGWISVFLGWRRSMLLCFAVCFICSILLFKMTISFSPFVYFEIGLLGFFFGVSQGVLSDFISKIFPRQIRATATGFCFNAGRMFTATVVFFVGWLVNILGGYGNSIFVFSWVFVIGFIAAFFLKENAMVDYDEIQLKK